MKSNSLNLLVGAIIGYALGQFINLNAIFSILIKWEESLKWMN